MLFHQKIKKWSDSFENKAVRLIAFWGSITGLLALFPTIIAGCVWLYFFFVDLSNISTYVKEFKKSAEYSNFMDMQEQSMLHEEMDADTIYGVILQKTNHGDLYYFDTIRINGVLRTICYGASVKNKASKNGLHVYITDMGGKVRWVHPEKLHRH